MSHMPARASRSCSSSDALRSRTSHPRRRAVNWSRASASIMAASGSVRPPTSQLMTADSDGSSSVARLARSDDSSAAALGAPISTTLMARPPFPTHQDRSQARNSSGRRDEQPSGARALATYQSPSTQTDGCGEIVSGANQRAIWGNLTTRPRSRHRWSGAMSAQADPGYVADHYAPPDHGPMSFARMPGHIG